MKLTDPEKLILVMLSEIYEKLGIRGETDTQFLLEAIYQDHTWALSWEMPGIVQCESDETPPEVEEVMGILDMWHFVETSYESFDATEKDEVDSAVGAGAGARFMGFDGNNETKHMSIARFLVERMGRFQHFKGREFNAHHPTLYFHRPMVSAFNSIRSTNSLGGDQNLSVSQVIHVLTAHMSD